MSCWTKPASALIFSSAVGDAAVRAATFCLIWGDESNRPATRPLYQVPISCQSLNTLVEVPPGGKRETIIFPATPGRGGICSSSRIARTSETLHRQTFDPAGAGLTSG